LALPDGVEGQDGHSDGKAEASRANSDPDARQSPALVAASSAKQPKQATLKEMQTEIRNRVEGLKIPPTLGE